jgi:paraquat-inducible protein B
MSLRASPTAIGLFMIGGIVLTVAGVATLASTSLLEERPIFISFFGESVNGLVRGAPVKFQGVPVGTVTELLIRIDERDKTFEAPVQYEIDLTRLTTQTGSYLRLDEPAVLRQQVADGLRAQLQMESMVTGQLYIELSYRPEAPLEPGPGPTLFPAIPTTPSLLAALGTGAGSLVADVLQVLFQVNQLLDEVDMPGINAAVVASAEAVQRLAEAPEIRAALEQVPGMTAQAQQALAEVQRLAERAGAAVDPIQLQLEGTATEATATLQALRRSLDEMAGVLSTDSELGYGLQETLASLRAAADALSLLATSLEQNPDMLIRGKKPPENR